MRQANRHLPCFIFGCIALLLSALPGRASAEVRDAADYFSPQAERAAENLIGQIRQRHGKDVVVETVQTVPGAPQPGAAREEFFEREVARRGKEAGVNGVYFLVSREPSSFYLGVDPQTQKGAFKLEDRGAVRDQVLERFKAKDFDGGLLAALKAIDDTMAANASGKGATGTATPGGGASGGATGGATGGRPDAGGGSPTPTGGACGEMGMGSILLLVIAGLAVFAIMRALSRRRQPTAGGGYGGPGYGQPGMGQPGPGQPGYDPRYDPRSQQQGGMMGGAGGGMGRGILGGVLGGVAGGYLYDQMRGGGGNEAQAASTPPPLDPNTTPLEAPDATTSGFADFGDPGGADLGGGGDFGGGDMGGGGDF